MQCTYAHTHTSVLQMWTIAYRQQLPALPIQAEQHAQGVWRLEGGTGQHTRTRAHVRVRLDARNHNNPTRAQHLPAFDQTRCIDPRTRHPQHSSNRASAWRVLVLLLIAASALCRGVHTYTTIPGANVTAQAVAAAALRSSSAVGSAAAAAVTASKSKCRTWSYLFCCAKS